MSDPGALAAALTFLPTWWQETRDSAALETILQAWARTCGWRSCGLVWPASDTPTVVYTIANGVSAPQPAPVEVPDAIRRLRAGEETVTYPEAEGVSRMFAALKPTGRPPGVLWVDQASSEPWSATDHALLTLTARAMERAPAVLTHIGSVSDSEALQQRLADAAVIAGRMAHDFDNILTGIIGFSDLVVPLLPQSSQAINFVTEIGKAGQRGISFTQQLHQLSRGGQVKPNPAVIATAVAKEIARVKQLGIPGIEFATDIPDGLPTVGIEAGVLQTIFGRVIENAAEACTAGGRVIVAAKSIDLSEADTRAYLGRPDIGPNMLVTVTDSGTGIKPEVRRRLFADPFFTTKVRHRGLGLAITYRVLWAHRGGIQIEPALSQGTGTQVRIVLPLATVAPPATAGTPAGLSVPNGKMSTTAVGG